MDRSPFDPVAAARRNMHAAAAKLDAGGSPYAYWHATSAYGATVSWHLHWSLMGSVTA